MAFRPRTPPEMARLQAVQVLLERATPKERARLEAEQAALHRALDRRSLAINAERRVELEGQSDLHAQVELRELDVADLELRRRLDPRHAERYDQALDRARDAYDSVAALERAERERAAAARRAANDRAAVAGAMRALPWIRARTPEDPIYPRGCPTCADSPTRFSPQAFRQQSRPVTAAAIRSELAAKYPGWVDDGPMRSVMLGERPLREQCGPAAAACAAMGSESVYLPRSGATPALVAHETLHALTSAGWAARVPSTVNEAVTEYLTRKMGYFEAQGGVRKKAYEGGQQLLADYVAARPDREAALAKAYFTGDFSDLEALEDSSLFGRFLPRSWSLDRRFREFDSALANVRPGTSVTIDDEELPRVDASRPGH